MPATARIASLAEEVVRRGTAAGLILTAAESCTGGMIGAALTDVPGSSAVFERGFVTYSNEAKIELLGVSEALLRRCGAVSAEVAVAMSKGALEKSRADIALSVTGVAGPGGGSADKPVGLVWLAVAGAARIRTERRVFSGGGRGFIRTKTVEAALTLFLQEMDGAS